MTTTKNCTACHGTFSLSAFASKGPNRLQPHCRTCTSAYNHTRYLQTADTRRPQLHERKRAEQARLQELLAAARLGKVCATCASPDNLSASSAVESLSHLVRSQRADELITALASCTWLCHRCQGAASGQLGAGVSHVKGAPTLDEAVIAAVRAKHTSIEAITTAVLAVRATTTKAGVRQRLSALSAQQQITRTARGHYAP
jgi:hypothetical protein